MDTDNITNERETDLGKMYNIHDERCNFFTALAYYTLEYSRFINLVK